MEEEKKERKGKIGNSLPGDEEQWGGGWWKKMWEWRKSERMGRNKRHLE